MKNLANTLRILSADMVERANSGHPGMPLGMADLAAVLFSKFLKFNPHDPNWPNRDRFIVSNGHGSALLYSLLHLCGYDLPMSELTNFRQLHSKTPGHPEYLITQGVETTTGPLGQGIANAVGMAISEKKLKARFGSDLVDHKIWVFCGDGCLQEGISHEAMSLAGSLCLNNLIIVYDDNNITIDGPTSLSFNENVAMRAISYGFEVIEIDGHDINEIESAFSKACQSQKPILIKAKTVIGWGSPNLAGTAKSHGSPLGAEEIEALRAELGWNLPPFEIPSNIKEEFANFWLRNQENYEKWLNLAALNADFTNHFLGLDDSFWLSFQSLKDDLTQIPTEATRVSSGKIIDFITSYSDKFIGGSADLTPSNNTKGSKQQPISANNFSGSYIHYGVREHAMAAIMNGISIYGGYIPYGGTFLTFTDYMRPAIRLSALMKLRVIYVMTHDSIGLGEDGPTHQAVEHLNSLRLIPNVTVLRPCDLIETIECWEIALKNSDGPTILALSRQNLMPINSKRSTNNSSLGAYIIEEQANFKVTLFASGSEVEIAKATYDLLIKAGISARLVSVPGLDLLTRKNSQQVINLCCNNSLKVAIEAGTRGQWSNIIGPHGLFFGVETFGESAPAKELYKHFRLTANDIFQEITNKLESA